MPTEGDQTEEGVSRKKQASEARIAKRRGRDLARSPQNDSQNDEEITIGKQNKFINNNTIDLNVDLLIHSKLLSNNNRWTKNERELHKLEKEICEKTINFYDDNSKLSKFSKFSEKWGKRILMISFAVLAFTILGFLSEYVIEISEKFLIT